MFLLVYVDSSTRGLFPRRGMDRKKKDAVKRWIPPKENHYTLKNGEVYYSHVTEPIATLSRVQDPPEACWFCGWTHG